MQITSLKGDGVVQNAYLVMKITDTMREQQRQHLYYVCKCTSEHDDISCVMCMRITVYV